jgi:hypothetical protein
MIQPKEFIKSKLTSLVSIFDSIICRYEFHKSSNAHYIEINPSEQFNNISLQEAMAELMYSFYDVYPNESLVFLTESDGFDLVEPEFMAKGINYKPSWSCFFSTQEKYELYVPDSIIASEESEEKYILAA